MTSWQDLWNSIDKLSSLITIANWGIAITLLVTFAFTVVVIKAGTRKDQLTGAEDLRKAEQIANLEHSNLTLRSQVATLEVSGAEARKDVAVLQKAAADAKASQQRVELDLAKQQEKTATAEHALLALQRRMEPRRISPEQRARLIEILSHSPKGKVVIDCVLGDAEGQTFANDIEGVLKASGWEAGTNQGVYSGGNPVGFGILVRNAATAPQYATILQKAFFAIGIPLAGAERPDLPEGTVQIVVGNKPSS
jgi:hypothetical protein